MHDPTGNDRSRVMALPELALAITQGKYLNYLKVCTLHAQRASAVLVMLTKVLLLGTKSTAGL